MGEGLMSESDVRPTPAAEFRAMRERGILHKLPSGRIVRLRNVRPDQLLRVGKIPDVLAALALKHLYGKLSDEEFWAFLDPKEAVDDALAVIDSLRVICTAALLEPRIVEPPTGENEIGFDDLDLADQRAIYNLAFLESNALIRFRMQPERDVAAVAEQPGDGEPSVAAGGGA
jgi:hypothetical protein